MSNDEDRIRHTNRFRKVSTYYPRRVSEAYDGDIARAAADSDEQVAATVADFERQHGFEPHDWHAIGAGERDPVDEGLDIPPRE